MLIVAKIKQRSSPNRVVKAVGSYSRHVMAQTVIINEFTRLVEKRANNKLFSNLLTR